MRAISHNDRSRAHLLRAFLAPVRPRRRTGAMPHLSSVDDNNKLFFGCTENKSDPLSCPSPPLPLRACRRLPPEHGLDPCQFCSRYHFSAAATIVCGHNYKQSSFITSGHTFARVFLHSFLNVCLAHTTPCASVHSPAPATVSVC